MKCANCQGSGKDSTGLYKCGSCRGEGVSSNRFEIQEDLPGYGAMTGAWVYAETSQGLNEGVEHYLQLYPVGGYNTHTASFPAQEDTGWKVRVERYASCD